MPYSRDTCPRWRAIRAQSIEPDIPGTSTKEWLSKCVRRCEKADFYLLSDKKEEAYILYLRAIDIYINRVIKAPDLKAIKDSRNEKFISFSKRLDNLYSTAEKLKEFLLKQYESDYENSRKAAHPAKKSFDSAPDRSASAKPVIGISSPNYKPQSSLHAASSPSIALAPQSKKPRDVTIYNRGSQAKSFERPSNMNSVISPEKLIRMLNSSRMDSSFTVLFIDIREPHKFKSERMNVNFLINIDPLLLPKNVSSTKIEVDLNLHASDPANLFFMREKFDLVVITDEDSSQVVASVINAEAGAGQNHLHNLVLAITEYEPTKHLKQKPLLLEGGFRAWKEFAGSPGITRLPPPAKKTDNHAMRRNAISPARSKPIIKSLEHFFRQSQEHTPSGKSSMQTPSPLISTPLHELQNPLPSPLGHGSVDGSFESFHSTHSPLDSPVALTRQKTVFDNPLYGFTLTKEDTKSSAERKPVASLDSLYLPPDAATKTPAGPVPPPLPPKPKSLKAARPCTPPLVSSLSYAMNIGTTGLRNLGNTCYMNSIIQCINGTIPLSRYFLDGSFKMHINRDNPLGYGGILVDAFEELVRVLWTEGSSYISPTKFKAAVGKASFQFKGNDQQDSQEFLAFLLDGLHEDLNLVKKRPVLEEDDDDYLEKLSDQEASDYAWDRYLQRNNSIIVSLFKGQLKSRLQCSVCSKTSVTFNTFMYLSLPIPSLKSKTTPVHLLECLDLFAQEETLDGENAWFCPRCKCARSSTKRLTISRLPDVLLIHLKRFSYEGPFRNKLDTHVDVPIRGLNLERYIPRSAPKSSILSPKGTPIGNSYDLYAVSNHYGSLNGGHYTASVRNGFGGKWHSFDDSRVTTITEKEAVTKAAYNLFYVRTNSETAHL